MPQVFKIGSYIIYFWVNENKPLEPVHVHIAEGVPQANATKVWITQSGKTILANNNSNISKATLRKLLRMIEANTEQICDKWYQYFEEISFYC